MTRFLVAGVAVIGLAVGCGGSKSSATAGSDTSQASGTQTPEQVAARGIEDAIKSVQGAAKSQAKAVEYAELKKLIPDVAGWQRSDVKGEQSNMMGMSFSRAEGEFKKGDMSVRLEITDTAMIQALVMPFAMLASGGFNQKSDDGYKQGVTISGNPGWEEWENEGKSGEVNLLVAKRFIVHAQGHDLPNMDPAKQIVQAVNVSSLANLK